MKSHVSHDADREIFEWDFKVTRNFLPYVLTYDVAIAVFWSVCKVAEVMTGVFDALTLLLFAIVHGIQILFLGLELIPNILEWVWHITSDKGRTLYRWLIGFSILLLVMTITVDTLLPVEDVHLALDDKLILVVHWKRSHAVEYHLYRESDEKVLLCPSKEAYMRCAYKQHGRAKYSEPVAELSKFDERVLGELYEKGVLHHEQK